MQQSEWSPPTLGIAGCGLLGVAMAIAAVTVVTDPPGRILGGVAAVGLVTFAIMSWRARPKLAITADGVAVRGWWNTRVLTPADVKLVRITEFRRLARKQRLLEIETTDDGLHVLTRWDLGADPLDVLDALTAAGYTGAQ
ncbi:PH domain-containing protein [Mycolicibacterium baixiangningiae]|uniref:PH domain-containing protein n=1 Tax=Mycolicibacterium baixiangningiae TaxID=2761578 RepID=UPI0018D13E99|nr:PH domain-containing protein [Mycolicibacterium baixiangningiae]